MKSIRTPSLLALLPLALSSANAADCLPIEGTVMTQSLNQTEQLGTITLQSKNVSEFKKIFGSHVLHGGLKGTITAQPDPLHAGLKHQYGFPDVGTLNSNDEAEFDTSYPIPDSNGNIHVQEKVGIYEGTGRFANWSFVDVLATGTINIVTGFNTFSVNGRLCPK